MRMLVGFVLVGTFGFFVACGGTSSVLLDGDDAGAGGDAGGDAGNQKDGSTSCVNPAFGEACTTSESVCGQVGQGNPCCDSAWRCLDGKWQSLAANCACVTQSEGCGDKTCTAGQYCQVQPPGIAFPDGGTPPTDYECIDPPSSCAGAPTCACLEAAPPCSIASCTDSQGEVATLVTVNCIGE